MVVSINRNNVFEGDLPNHLTVTKKFDPLKRLLSFKYIKVHMFSGQTWVLPSNAKYALIFLFICNLVHLNNTSRDN